MTAMAVQKDSSFFTGSALLYNNMTTDIVMSQINPIHDPNTISLINNNNNNFKLALTFRSRAVTCPFSPEFQTVILYHISHIQYVTVAADAPLNLPSYLPYCQSLSLLLDPAYREADNL